MSVIRKASGAAIAGMIAVVLAGCSVDALIWGNGGAKVIETTETLVADLSEGESSDLICEESVADLGGRSDWKGLSAGEPEEFVAEYWEGQAALDPQWSINLEGLPEGAAPGDEHPSDVFYRESDAGLCVIDVVWATLVAVG